MAYVLEQLGPTELEHLVTQAVAALPEPLIRRNATSRARTPVRQTSLGFGRYEVNLAFALLFAAFTAFSETGPIP